MDAQSLLVLTAVERRELENLRDHPPNVRAYRRALGLLHIDDGNTPEMVADAVHVDISTVYRWIRRFDENRSPEALLDRPRSGRPPALGALSEQQFEHIIDQSPKSYNYQAFQWTVPLLRDHLKRIHHLEASDETIRRRLHQQGYQWKRPRYVFIEADPLKGQKKGGSFARSSWRESPPRF